jgi:hypothetical protein
MRRHHLSSNNSKSSLKSKDLRCFEDYYKKKMETSLKHGETSKVSESHSGTKNHDAGSMMNSRATSNKSFHQRVQKQYSFQNILKEMNSRVLLSRQARKTVINLKENAFEGNEVNGFDYSTDREQRVNKMGKNHFGHKVNRSVFDIRNNFVA